MPLHCSCPHNTKAGSVPLLSTVDMSLQNVPGSFGVVFPAFTLPKAERSCNKERLEASLAGLYELELLKQRQESRVLGALCLGDSPAPSAPSAPSAPCYPLLWGAPRAARCSRDESKWVEADACGLELQNSSVECSHLAIKESLEQQVAELKMNTEVNSADSSDDLEDNHLSSAPAGTRDTSRGVTWISDSITGGTVTNGFGEMRDVNSNEQNYQQAQKVETYIFGLVHRRVFPTRPLKPRTNLAHDVRTVGMVRQGNLSCKVKQHSPKQETLASISSPSQCLEGSALQSCNNHDQEHYLEIEFTEEAPPPYQLQQSVLDQLGLYHKPRQAFMINTSNPTILDYPICRELQAHPDSSNSDPDSPQHFHSFDPPPTISKPHQLPPDEQLVSAEYIPAQPSRASTRAYSHHHSNPHNGSGVSKPNHTIFSPERGHRHQEQQPTIPQMQPFKCRGGPKKVRSNEDRSSSTKKLGKKACRSQSENSLPRVPEHKYNTVERDGGGSGRGVHSNQSKNKKQQQGSGNYHRWLSTLDLSQDEADQSPIQAPMQCSLTSNQRDHCVRRTRKSSSTHASYAYPQRNYNHHHYYSHHHQHMECQSERDQVPLCQPSDDYSHPRQGESESSMSEANSPDSSSLSSDSDESSGLVWPQQLPPQLSLPSPHARPGASLQPKAFVKIKASHALKKKILRFRTGSLKVMTTV